MRSNGNERPIIVKANIEPVSGIGTLIASVKLGLEADHRSRRISTAQQAATHVVLFRPARRIGSQYEHDCHPGRAQDILTYIFSPS